MRERRQKLTTEVRMRVGVQVLILPQRVLLGDPDRNNTANMYAHNTIPGTHSQARAHTHTYIPCGTAADVGWLKQLSAGGVVGVKKLFL
jgi:hypothetical protein